MAPQSKARRAFKEICGARMHLLDINEGDAEMKSELPFVKAGSFWSVPEAVDYREACDIGRAFAVQFLQLLRDTPEDHTEISLDALRATLTLKTKRRGVSGLDFLRT
jgi:hypothetical protein